MPLEAVGIGMSASDEYWFNRLVLDGFDVEIEELFDGGVEIRVKKGLLECSAQAATEQEAVAYLFKGMRQTRIFNNPEPLKPWEQV